MMKVMVKRDLKAIFYCHRKNKNADRLCMKFSSTSNTSVQQVLQPLKSTPPYSVAPSFPKNVLTPRPGSI